MRLFEVTRAAYVLIAAGTLATLLMAILVGVGGLDRLSNDGSVDGTVALQALGLYWLLGVLIVLAVTYRRRYWKQYLLTVGAVVLACGTPEVTLRVLYPALSVPKCHLEINGAVETERFFVDRHPLQVTRSYFDASWENIKRIEEKCREIGARFIQVVSPRFHHWNPKECPHNWEAFAYGLDEPHQDTIFDCFDEQATTASSPVHTMLKEFQATRESPLVFETDLHWNWRGHRFVAERLVELLAREAPEVLGEQQ